jgi:hypothetical protein
MLILCKFLLVHHCKRLSIRNMLGSTSPIYEIVSGQILLGKQENFYQLHRDVLLPMIHEAGIEPVLMLITEVGRYARFLDIYRYSSLDQYGKLTDSFLQNKQLSQYYSKIGQCIDGSIQVELALEFPHLRGTQKVNLST